jgi:hypothetical protein
MLTVNLGVHRGKLYINSGDTLHFIVYNELLSDGTPVTIRNKHHEYNWVTVNEDNDYEWYPMDLLVPISKTNRILERL